MSNLNQLTQDQLEVLDGCLEELARHIDADAYRTVPVGAVWVYDEQSAKRQEIAEGKAAMILGRVCEALSLNFVRGSDDIAA